MRLYHFLEAKWALDDIRRRRLKVSRLDTLNDPFEFLAVDTSDKQFRRALMRTRTQMVNFHGIICFCDNWRNPVMWAHYGERYKGICLGFDVFGPDGGLMPVDYVAHKPKLPANFHALPEGERYAFFNRLSHTKFNQWSYEGEYRLFVGLNTIDHETNQYFFDFGEHLTLREVIVGASSEVTRAEVREALGPLASTVEAFKSRPGFGKFEIVRNKDKNAWK